MESSQATRSIRAWVAWGLALAFVFVGACSVDRVVFLGFDATTVPFTKVAAIAVITQELARFSDPAAEGLVRDSLADTVIARVDTDLFDPDLAAVANVSPAGLLNGVTPISIATNTIDYADQGRAIADLRNGRVNGVLTIPPDFSRRVLSRNEPRVALIEDNTDGFVSVALAGTLGSMLAAYGQPARAPRISRTASLDVVEIYPYVPYVQYLLPGSVVMSIFMMVMIGGGIIFIDDKARGLHEGYLVTPIKKVELIAGFNISGTIKAVLAGMFLLLIGSLIAGIPNPFDPMRLLRLFVVVVVTSFSLISLMFLLMVRVSDPLLPRAVFGILNTVLYFPSGAVYPQQGFPGWMQVIAVMDPFTYAVHAFKSLLLKHTGFAA